MGVLPPGSLPPRVAKTAFAVGGESAAESSDGARAEPSREPDPEPTPVPDLQPVDDGVEAYVSPEELLRGQYCDALGASVRETEKRLARWAPGTTEWFQAKAEALECEVSRSVCMGLLDAEVDKQRFDTAALKISVQERNATSQALTLEMQHLRRAGRAGLAHRVASQMESASSAAGLTDKGRLRCWGWAQAICSTMYGNFGAILGQFGTILGHFSQLYTRPTRAVVCTPLCAHAYWTLNGCLQSDQFPSSGSRTPTPTATASTSTAFGTTFIKNGFGPFLTHVSVKTTPRAPRCVPNV